jgi:glutamate synthase (NADPH) large chain
MVRLQGQAGQSFGAWAAHGVTLELTGEGNDYVGKGLSGGKIIIRPFDKIGFKPEESIIVGNTVMYGAITGQAYFRGVAGERFAVRNSGAIAVVEGTGDHGCEYMTGGCVVVIGKTGRNFAAGMSGGVAYVLDEDQSFEKKCNMSMVVLEKIADDRVLYDEASFNVLHQMDRHDAQRLHYLLSRHAKYTGSESAKTILGQWHSYLPKFVKVMPTEYARALADMEKARNVIKKSA